VNQPDFKNFATGYLDVLGMPLLMRTDKLAGRVGFDYLSNNPGSLTLEANYSILLSHKNNDPKIEADKANGAIIWNKTFFRDDLNVSVAQIHMGSLKDFLSRLYLSYNLSDSLQVSSQYTFITATSVDAYTKPLENLDRAELGLNYSVGVN
jgi:hypothetical protein